MLSTEFAADTARAVLSLLSSARRRRNLYLSTVVALVILMGFGAIAIVKISLSHWDEWQRSQARSALVQRLKGSDKIWTKGAIDSEVARFQDDPELAVVLLRMKEDPEIPDVQRLNAHILATAIGWPRLTSPRWAIKQIDWGRSSVSSGQLVDVTFMTGSISDVQFERATFAGVVWGPAPDPPRDGLKLGSLVFRKCSFHAGAFEGTSGIKLDFVNCSFRGTKLGMDSFAYVNFRSEQKDPNSTLITDEVTVFENSVIQMSVPAPSGKGLVIESADAVPSFENVVFRSCHFRGQVKPSWFKKCHFTSCVLPKSITQKDLTVSESYMDACIWSDEPTD